MTRFGLRVMALVAVAAGLVAPAAANAAVTPVDGFSYPAGTDFTLPCGVLTPRPDAHVVSSKVFRADPRVPAHVYPAHNYGWDIEHPNTQSKAPWPAVSFVASGDADQNSGTAPCKQPEFAQSNGDVVPGTVFTIWQPGYYHLIEFDITEHHQPLQPPPFPPDNATCADDTETSDQAHLSIINAWGDTMVVGHCRHYINIYFTVYDYPDCQGVPGPPYVATPYINQYDWGNSDGLPRDQYNVRGGNACGSSSLNTMLFNATKASAGTKPAVSLYNETANRPVGNLNQNEFNFNKARAVLVSMGYLSARVVDLGGSVGPNGVADENQLSDWLKQGPVLTSTLFGAGDWSTAGGGHVILFLRKQAAQGAGESPGDYIVSDPAGPFFIDPSDHYGAGKCGYLARYPVTWTAALTLNRWGLLLGPRNRLPFFFPSGDRPGAIVARAGHTAVLLEVPNGVSVWVQDRTGHRVGFVGQNTTVALSDIGLGDEPAAPSDPLAPFASASALVPDRGIIALDPGKGLTLVASGPRGHRVTAQMFVYHNGALIKTVTTRAALRLGVTRLLSVPSVPGAHNLPLGQLRLTVKSTGGLFGISVSSRAPFAGFVKVTVSQGSRSVGFGAKSVKAGAFSVPVFLFPGTTGTVTVTAKLVGSGRSVSGSTTAAV